MGAVITNPRSKGSPIRPTARYILPTGELGLPELGNRWVEHVDGFTISYPFESTDLSNARGFCTYILTLRLINTADTLKGHRLGPWSLGAF